MIIQNERKKIYLTIMHGFICTVILFVVVVLQNNYPVIFTHLVMEDYFGEYVTFMCFLIASISIAWSIRISRSLFKPFYFLLSLGLFFIAMEEISWGQRLIGIDTPYFIAKNSYQREINFHNLSILEYKMEIFYFVMAVWIFALPLLSWMFKNLQHLLKKIQMPLVPYRLWPYFIVSLVLLCNENIIIKNNEIGEFFLGLAFAIFAANMLCNAYKDVGDKTWDNRKITSAAMLLILIPAFLLGGMKPMGSGGFHWLAEVGYPGQNMNEQVKKTYEYIIDHPELKTDLTLVQYGKFLKENHDLKANKILLEALQEQKDQMQLQIEKPGPHRLAGKIYILLGENELANKEFQLSLEKDKKRLSNATVDWQKYDALSSMGETYIEMGEESLAVQRLEEADKFADAVGRKEIGRLIEKINKSN